MIKYCYSFYTRSVQILDFGFLTGLSGLIFLKKLKRYRFNKKKINELQPGF